jgi:hypothetical protein
VNDDFSLQLRKELEEANTQKKWTTSLAMSMSRTPIFVRHYVPIAFWTATALYRTCSYVAVSSLICVTMVVDRGYAANCIKIFVQALRHLSVELGHSYASIKLTIGECLS